MSYGVHKVTPVHGTMCEQNFRDLAKGQEKVNELWGPQKSVSDARTDGSTDGRYYQIPTGVIGSNVLG